MPNEPSEPTGRLEDSPPTGFFAAGDGSDDPYADLYDRLSRRIFRFFLRRIENEEIAFDLMAETFAKGFEKRDHFRGTTDELAEAWIWSVARAVLGTYSRTKRVELSALARIGLAPEEDPEKPLEAVEHLNSIEFARRQVKDALDELPPQQAEVVRLRLIAEFTYAEIARRLGISGTLARARGSRGIRRLKMNDALRAAIEELEL
jgi:RNA polymerase sigma factor (sigma-70 family)